MTKRANPIETTPSIDGLLVIDKPGGITSRTACDQVLTWFEPGTRIGHTGTLDPLATGVLVLCFGKATRLADYVQRMGKTYRTTLVLGARSDTDDADGRITPSDIVTAPDLSSIVSLLGEFVGSIEQIPPDYSAARVDGKRAYALARKGREVTLAPRLVKIYGIDIVRLEYPELELEIRCGKGTYIRSIARDFGERLGCGAYVRQLRRTKVGPFLAEQGITLDSDPESARENLLPMRYAVTELPRLTLPATELTKLKHGQHLEWKAEALPQDVELEYAIFDEAGELHLIAELDRESQRLHAEKVLYR